MRIAARLFWAIAIAAILLTGAGTALADAPGFLVHVPEDAPRDYEPGVTAADFYTLLDSALHKNFESLIMVFGGCYAGDFASQMPASEVGKAGKPVAAMTATGTEIDQRYEQTPGTIIGNAFIQSVNNGWSTADSPNEFVVPELSAFASGESGVGHAIDMWNAALTEESEKATRLKKTHPRNQFVAGGEKLTLPQLSGAKKYAIIFVGQPQTAQDWRDYADVFRTLDAAGYEIQGFFGSGKRHKTDGSAILPNGHSVLEDAGPEVKTDPDTHQTYGGHRGPVETDYETDVPVRKDGVSKIERRHIAIPFGRATAEDLRVAMEHWRDASGKSCAVFYFTAFGHFTAGARNRVPPLKVGGDTAPDCSRHAYRTLRRGTDDSSALAARPDESSTTDGPAAGSVLQGIGVTVPVTGQPNHQGGDDDQPANDHPTEPANH